MKVECAAPSPHVRLCSVAHPVFRTGAKVNGKEALREQVLESVGPGSLGKEVHKGSCSSAGLMKRNIP